MTVYVVTMVGVYGQGCCGVFTDRVAAEAHAQAHGDDSDGYHDYRINEVVVDEPIWLGHRGQGPRRRGAASVMFVGLEA